VRRGHDPHEHRLARRAAAGDDAVSAEGVSSDVAAAIPTAASRPEAIAAGPDGAVWFLENAANQIGRIATDGSITEWWLRARGVLAPVRGRGPSHGLPGLARPAPLIRTVRRPPALRPAR
jgi:hypothetical protein